MGSTNLSQEMAYPLMGLPHIQKMRSPNRAMEPTKTARA